MLCSLCPRNCKIQRNTIETGFCNAPEQIKIARYSLHMWEEPCISGQNGSGTVFFSGCNLGCIYCQNSQIAHKNVGEIISKEDLIKIFLYLQSIGANNINLVTPTHYIHILPEVIIKSKEAGLSIPIVYNSSGYEKIQSLRALNGLIDVYLPDFKYMDSAKAKLYSNAEDYPETAFNAIKEMYAQVGPCVFDNKTKLIKKGVIVRHLVLPSATNNSIKVLDKLYNEFGDNIYISIMNQYTPPASPLKQEELNRKITSREYEKVINHALSVGIKNAFIQDGETAKESFIPEFTSNIIIPD